MQSMVGSVRVNPGSWNHSLSLRIAGKQRQLISGGNGHVSGKDYARKVELILNVNYPLHELGHRIICCQQT